MIRSRCARNWRRSLAKRIYSLHESVRVSRWTATVVPAWDAQRWREVARTALCADVEPQDLDWDAGGQANLLAPPDVYLAPVTRPPPTVSRSLLQLADSVLCHRWPGRHALLYQVAWRMTHGEPRVLDNPADVDTHRLYGLAQDVRRDSHKMKAFVRFRALPGEEQRFLAWFEPGHDIVDRVAPFFARRFAGMRWSILTPYRSAAWDGHVLSFGAGADAAQIPADDAGEDLWRTYYANIFNPARINPRMMQQEMPQRYWKHLPEARLIPDLLRQAGARVAEMQAREAQAPRRRVPSPLPAADVPREPLPALAARAKACRACPLWEKATQTVVGEGPHHAEIMLVGEQPGDAEDLSGRPFVGPAGRLLDRVLAELGLSRHAYYLTNVVKHFHFEQRGKMRLHRNPDATHVAACSSWLAQELALVRPSVIVTLGATAAQAMLGKDFQLLREHGQWRMREDGVRMLPTVHPAWVLRQASGQPREAAYALLREDLRRLVDLQLDPSS